MTYPTTALPRGPTLWPDRTVAKIQYTDYTTVSLIPTGIIANAYYYRMNYPYAPRASGIEDTPGLAEYSEQYSRYRVLATSISVEVAPAVSGGVSNSPFVVLAPYTAAGAQPFQVATTPDVVKISAGNPYAVSKFMPYNGVSGLQAGNGKLYRYITMEKLHGGVDPLTTSTFAGSTGNGTSPSAPSQQTYWYVAATTMDEIASTATTAFIVKINYWVEFYARDFEYQ